MLIHWVMLGGAVGAGARYLLIDWVSRSLGAAHIGVFLANVLGSLLIGLIIGAAIARGDASPKLVAFLTTGLLGGFTTFSTFSMDAFRLIEGGRFGTAAAYVLGSLIFGLAAAAVGAMLGRALAG